MTDQLRSQPMSKHTQSSPVSDNQPFDDTRKLTMALGEMSRAERENIELGRRLEAAEAYIEELKAELRAQAATAQVPPNTTGGALCPKPPCTAFPDCGCVAQPDAAATPKATADERWCLANNISCNDPTVAQPSCIFEVRNMDGSIAMSGTSRAWCRVHGGFDCAPIPSAEGK
jgi:hypothetical protein